MGNACTTGAVLAYRLRTSDLPPNDPTSLKDEDNRAPVRRILKKPDWGKGLVLHKGVR